MQQLILIIQAVTQLFPMVIQIVKSVEQAIPQSGQGTAKLDLVRAMLESAYAGLQEQTVAFEHVWPTIQSMINGIVKIYNAIGEFKKA